MAHGEWDLEPRSTILSSAATADECEVGQLRSNKCDGEDDFGRWDDAWIDLGGEA
jgi:hypothetical protein